MNKLDKNWIAFALYVTLFWGIGVYFNGIANIYPVFFAMAGVYIFAEAFSWRDGTPVSGFSLLVLILGGCAFIIFLPHTLGLQLNEDSGAVWWQAPDSKNLVTIAEFGGSLLLIGLPWLWFWLTGQLSEKQKAPA